MAIKILVIEDNPADVYLLEEALRANDVDFNLEWIADGEQALTRLSRVPDGAEPALVLVDLNLPRVDGKELLSAIRQTPAFRDTLVAVLTSSDSPADRRDTEALGANCYIKKPPTLDEFLSIGRVIKELISGVSS
jgi:CheY-like chemotaxis protein